MPIQRSPYYSYVGMMQARGSGLLPSTCVGRKSGQPWPELPQPTLSAYQPVGEDPSITEIPE